MQPQIKSPDGLLGLLKKLKQYFERPGVIEDYIEESWGITIEWTGIHLRVVNPQYWSLEF
jgi:hypothetical protein